jgi:hypothetical protein
VLVAFFTKCAFCWAAYLSLFGVAGSFSGRSYRWFFLLLVFMLAINILSLYFTRKRHQVKPLLLSVAGASLLVVNRLLFDHAMLLIMGSMLLITASLWNALSRRMALSVGYYFRSFLKLMKI